MTIAWNRAIGPSILALSLLPGMAPAQDAAGSLDELLRSAGLRPGDGIYVTDVRGHRLKGTIRDLSSTAVEVTHRDETWRLAGEDVLWIERQDSWADGLGYGLLAGAASFLALCRTAGARDCGLYLIHPEYSGFFLAVGGLVGTIVDASTHKVVYRAAGSARAVVEPIASDGRYGARLSVGW